MEKPPLLSASSSGSRRSSASNSPEFEFRNPSAPESFLHSADELFSGGVLLPLHQLNTPNSDNQPDKNTSFNSIPPTITTAADPNSAPLSESATTLIAPKRWKDMFKKNSESKEKEKKKKERNGGTEKSGMAELNINLWPFSRSKSAGNNGSRPRPPASNRKVSSAPCSRSNSAGESKKWLSSPNRGGVHVGRSSPVWQMKRVGSGRSLHDSLVRNAAEKGGFKKERVPKTRRSKKSTAGGDPTVAGSSESGRVGAKVKVLHLNVQTCIGYRHHLSCRSDEIQEEKSIRVAGGNAGEETRSSGVFPGGEGPRGSNLLNLRNLFAKRVY